MGNVEVASRRFPTGLSGQARWFLARKGGGRLKTPAALPNRPSPGPLLDPRVSEWISRDQADAAAIFRSWQHHAAGEPVGESLWQRQIREAPSGHVGWVNGKMCLSVYRFRSW
jgi:hypothetical protein